MFFPSSRAHVYHFPVLMFGGGFGPCRVTTSCQVSSRCCMQKKKSLKKFLHQPFSPGWELSGVTHPGARCSLPPQSVQHHWKRQHCEGLLRSVIFHFSHRDSFSGLWGGRGGANPVLEQGRDLRQEGGGPGGDGAHCGIGPSSSGPILSTWWPFWSWGCMNRSKWIESSIPGSVLTSYGYQSMLTVTQVEWFWKPPYILQVKNGMMTDEHVLCTAE